MRGHNMMRMIYFITFLRVLLLAACWLFGGNPGNTLRAFQRHEAYRTPPPPTYTRVGVVTIEGPIENSEMYLDQLTLFFSDPSIRAVLLIISSPGGLAGASSAISESISELKNAYPKPVITWVDELCASGAYLIAAVASSGNDSCIIASPQATIGSVGVIYQAWQLKKFLKQWGISRDVICAGDYKAVGNPYSENSQDCYEYIEAVLQDVYDIFIESVRVARPQLRTISHKEWADGKIFVATKALEAQLIDKIGGYLTVQETVRELGQIEGTIEWVHPAEPESIRAQPEYILKEQRDGHPYAEIITQLLRVVGHRPGIRMEYLP